MKNIHHLLVPIILIMAVSISAQEPEPTPFAPIIPLGNPNVGLPEPLLFQI